MQEYQVYEIWQRASRMQTHKRSQTHNYRFCVLTDSAFGAASAGGQLKGVRPCQSAQECWQTAPTETCVSVCVCERLDEQRADPIPPRPDFINQGRKRVQPLKLGLKTLLTVFLVMSVSPSRRSLPPPPTPRACVVGLIFLISPSVWPAMPTRRLCLSSALLR